MIDLVCPDCGDEMEIDPSELKDVDAIGCEECDATIAFTRVGDQIVLGEVLEHGECNECGEPIPECTCPDELPGEYCALCGELSDECTCDEGEGDTEIEEVEDEDGDA